MAFKEGVLYFAAGSSLFIFFSSLAILKEVEPNIADEILEFRDLKG